MEHLPCRALRCLVQKQCRMIYIIMLKLSSCLPRILHLALELALDCVRGSQGRSATWPRAQRAHFHVKDRVAQSCVRPTPEEDRFSTTLKITPIAYGVTYIRICRLVRVGVFLCGEINMIPVCGDVNNPFSPRASILKASGRNVRRI